MRVAEVKVARTGRFIGGRGLRDFVARRGGDLIVLIDEGTVAELRIVRGQ